MSQSDLEQYMGGMDLFSGGGLWEAYSANVLFWGSVVLVIYLVWWLWKNSEVLKGSAVVYNPMNSLPAKEGFDGVPFDYGMRMRSSLTSGDQIGTGQGLEGDIGRRSLYTGRVEGMWAPQNREGMTVGNFKAREGMHAEAPNFWDPNPYLTQAKEWGIPDLSSNFSNADPRSRVYYGGERGLNNTYQVDPSMSDASKEGMTASEDQLYSVMHGM